MMKFSKKAKALIVAGFIAVGTATPAHAVDLAGSGASFVDPLLQECKAGFNTATKHSYVYTSTGSSTGVKNSDAKIGDFWFSDVAHTAATKRSTVFHAPIVAAPIAVLVNLPGKKNLYLSATTVAKIFSGDITKWNDPAIQADNNRQITTVIYRKDKNGNVAKDASGNPIVLNTRALSANYTLPNQSLELSTVQTDQEQQVTSQHGLMVLLQLFGQSQETTHLQLHSQPPPLTPRATLVVLLEQDSHRELQDLQRKPSTQLHMLRRTGEIPSGFVQHTYQMLPETLPIQIL